MAVFRDETRMQATSSVLSSLQDELDHSGKLVVLLSPDSRDSRWVNEEVTYWLEKSATGIEALLPVLVNGGDPWADTDDARAEDPLPEALRRAYAPDEPLYVDLRSLSHLAPDDFPDLDDEVYRAEIVRIIAFARDSRPDDVEGEAVRNQRRTRRMIAAAIAIVALLAGTAFITSMLARSNAARATNEAEGAAAQELLRESTRLAPQDPGLAMILAAEATAYLPRKDNRVLTALTNARDALDRSGAAFPVIIDTDDPVVQLAFSEDDRILAALSNDGEILFWDGHNGEPLSATIRGVGPSSAIAFDGEDLLIAERGEARLEVSHWTISETPSRRPTTTIDGSFLGHTISDDGTVIAAVDQAGTVELRLTATGDRIGAISLERPTLDSAGPLMRFSADGSTLAVFNSRNDEYYEEVYFWDRRADEVSVVAYPSGFGLTSMDVSSKTDAFVVGTRSNSGGRGGGMGRWTMESVASNGSLFPSGFEEIADVSVEQLSLSPDGSKVATGSVDGEVQLWSYPGLEPFGESPSAHRGTVIDLTFNHRGDVMASASSDNTVALWRQGLGAEEVLRPNHPEAYRVTLDSAGETIASGSTDGSVEIWSAKELTGEAVEVVGLDGSPVGSLAFSRDGGLIAIGTFGTVAVAETRSGRVVRTLALGQSGYVTLTEFVGTGSLAFIATEDGRLLLWDSSSDAAPIPIEGARSVTAEIATSLDGTRMVSRDERGELTLWDLAKDGTGLSGRSEPLDELDGVSSLALNDDGSALFGLDANGDVTRYELRDGTVAVGTALGRTSTFAIDLEYVSELDVVATLDSDGTVRAWDAVSGREVAVPIMPAERPTYEGLFGVFFDLQVSDDGSTVIAVSDGNSIRVWHSWSVDDACDVGSRYVSRSQVDNVMGTIGVSPAVCFQDGS